MESATVEKLTPGFAAMGAESNITALFGAQAAAIRCQRRRFNFRYQSAAHVLKVFRDFDGTTHKAFGALDAAGSQSLERGINSLLEELDIGGPQVVPSEYLEIVVTKRWDALP